MSKSTQNFKKTKLVDYCDREGNISTSKKGNNPSGKWKLTYPNGEALASNFGYFLEEVLKNGYIKSFVLDDSDEKWIRETMKLSGEEDENLSERVEELKPALKSLTDFVNHRGYKRIYIREVWITSEKPSERRRVFTEEVLEIISILLKKQNSRMEDLLQKYRQQWKRENAYHSINMETFNSVLEEFNVNKELITVVPDPIYEMSKSNMLEYGKQTERRLSPYGEWLLDSSHAIFLIFRSVVWAINWKYGDRCTVHDNCHRGMKKAIIEVMRQYLNNPQGGLIPITAIDKTIEWIENQCGFTFLAHGTCFGIDYAIAIDMTPHSQSLSYEQVYQFIMQFYALPNYQSYVSSPNQNSPDFTTAYIPVWMTRVLLLAGWTEQFFDKESVEVANLILGLISKKVPVSARNGVISFLRSVQASICGLTYIPPPETNLLLNPTTNREEPASEPHQKMLRKAQERAEKLRKRKELSKRNKVKNPSSTNVAEPIRETGEELRLSDEFFGSSLLENQEYPEPKLTITRRTNTDNRVTVTHGPMTLVPLPYHKEREFGNVPNVFSLQDDTEAKEVLETGNSENSSTEKFVKEEATMKDEVDQILDVDEDPNAIDELKKEEQEDVTATEDKEELEPKDVKTLEKEVERLKETAGEDAQRANESESQLKEMVVEQELLKKSLEDAKKVIEEKESESKKFKEEKRKLVVLLDEKTKKVAIMENQIIDYEEVVKAMGVSAEHTKKAKEDLSLKLITVKEERDANIKALEEEKLILKDLLEEKSRKVDDVEKKMKLKDTEMNQMRSELKDLKGQKKQSEDQEKWRQKKNGIIDRLKSEADKFKLEVFKKEKGIVRLNNELSKSKETNKSLDMELSRLKEEAWKLQTANRRLLISEKGEEIVRLTNELSEAAEANERLVIEMSRLEEEMRKMKSVKKEKNESVQSELLKKNEELQTANRRLSILNEEQELRVQNLLDRLAKAPSPAVSTREEKPEKKSRKNQSNPEEFPALR
ncbi:unnamed protein product [Caenorhabditis nigoni]